MLDYEQVFSARQHLALSLLSYTTLHSSLKWASYFSMQELLGEIFLSVDYKYIFHFLQERPFLFAIQVESIFQSGFSIKSR